MKLIVGLGNPGKKYENTRHNVGYIFIDAFAKKNNVNNWIKKFNGLYAELFINSEKVLLLKPLSYMNLSGTVVKKYVDYFKIKKEDILIISDDLALEIGNYRLRYKGSSGGHNGLKNIEQCLGTSEYKRLKIGISNNNNIDAKDYVLGSFSKQENDTFEKMYDIICNILVDFNQKSFDCLMNIYNHK